MRGQMPMLKPTAALRESLMGVAPCFKYDQKGSVTCTPSTTSLYSIISTLLRTRRSVDSDSKELAFLLNQAYSLFMMRFGRAEIPG